MLASRTLSHLAATALLGAAALLPLHADITVTGSYSPAEPFWTNGGDINTDGDITNGSLTIDGAGFSVSTRDFALTQFGNPGNASLTIENGGTLISSGDGDVGLYQGDADATVTGSGSSWNITNQLHVGWGYSSPNAGSSILTIADGATVNVGTRSIISNGNTTIPPPADKGRIVFDNGTLNTGTLFARPWDLRGTGTINTGGLVRDGYEDFLLIDFNGSNVFNTTLNQQPGQNIDLTITADGSGLLGAGNYLVRNGAQIESQAALLGYESTVGPTHTTATVTGPDSVWTTTHTSFEGFVVGRFESATLNILKGGTVNSRGTVIGFESGSTGIANVHGNINAVGSQWNIDTGNFSIGHLGTGTLNLSDGSRVSNTGSITVNEFGTSSGTVNYYVTALGKLIAGGDFINNDTVRLYASPTLLAGTYSPIEAGGDFLGTGEYFAYGGTWNANNTFTASVIDTDGINAPGTDLSGARYAFNSDQLIVGFSQDAGLADQFDVTALTLMSDSFDGQEVLGGYSFITDLGAGGGDTTTLLSFEVGGGLDDALFTFWHSEDGITWTEFDPVSYVYTEHAFDGSYVSFLVDGFSSYAVTVVPEPGTGTLLLGALALLAARRRRG